MAGSIASNHRMFPNLLRERELHQEAIDARVLVQSPHEPEQRFLRSAGVEAMLEGSHSGLPGLSHLVAHVDLARRVFADQHHRESGSDRVHVMQADDLPAKPVAQVCGEGLAVDEDFGVARSFGHRFREAASRRGGANAAAV